MRLPRLPARVSRLDLQALQRSLRREIWLTVALGALLVLAAFAIALRFVQPAPPKHLTMSTGDETGGYHAYGRRYQELLARDGVTVELLPSHGSLENVARLMEPDSRVDVGFLQSGTSFAANAPHLVSLGSLYYEPLWVFYRGDEIDDLPGLRGKRIAIGPEYSGVRALALQLLAVNDVVLPPTELVPIGESDAAQALLDGKVDAAMFVGPMESPSVERLLAEPRLRLLSFERAEGYTRRFPYLYQVVLPEGSVDFARNVPRKDVVLIAPTANLLVQRDLHPALAYLLMRAAATLHSEAGMFNRRAEFPSAKDADFPLSAQARRFYDSGPPFLQRYLPFWAANLIDRLWVMALPVLAVLIPLSRILPALYGWRMRARIYRWYGRLKEIELQLEDKQSPDDLHEMESRLDIIEQSVNRIPTPLAYSANLYSFRQHIDLVRTRVQHRLADSVNQKRDRTS
jgi:TRAP transporter TAXI family solute receptor